MLKLIYIKKVRYATVNRFTVANFFNCQYPPHTQVLMNFTKDHNHLMHELYGLSMEICDDLAVLGRYPVCRARDRLATNPKVICFEQFTEGMIINDIRNLRKIAMNFRDEFWRLCDFYTMLSHMQGL